MWKRRAFCAAAGALAFVATPGCAPSKRSGATPLPVLAPEIASPSGDSLVENLSVAEQRVLDLETKLASRDREVADMRSQLDSARQREADTRSRLTDLEQRAARSAADRSVGGAAAVPDSAAASAAHADTAGSPQLVATLRTRLIEEQQQRAKLERDLKRMQEETSAGPFENKLQVDLRAAHDEIDQLRRTLHTERQERQKLAQRYETLQRQLETVAAPAPAPSDMQREEIAALKERQQRVLASIQRDLATSRQSEQALRETLASTQGGKGLPLAESVGNLRAENQALQARLDDEHQRNSELAGKLKIASRVTELIFKMQTAGAAAVASPSEVSAPLP